MNLLFRRICCSVLMASLLSAAALPVAAADQSGRTDLYLPSGNNATIQFAAGADSFFTFRDVIPGDKLTQEINIRNDRNEAVTFYLNATDTTQNLALLQKINLRVTNLTTGGVVYSGNLTGQPLSLYGDDMHKTPLTKPNGVNLGNYIANSTAKLKAELTVPVTIDNVFANKLSSITWQVRAEMPDVGTTTNPPIPGPGTTRPSTPAGPDTDPLPENVVTITDQDVPLGNQLFTIPDNQVPLADLPKTGGDSLFAAVHTVPRGGAMAALIGLAVVLSGSMLLYLAKL